MDSEQNQLIVRRFIEEFWNQRRLDLAEDLIAPDCVTHQLRNGESPEGALRSPESVRLEAEMWLAGFPDLTIGLEQLIAEGDLVMARCAMMGTHSGSWMGIEPTGKKVNVPMMTIHRIARGRIVEDWVLVGSLILFQQLGLLPPTAEIVRQKPL